jgi:hypothetical protein
MKFSFLSIAILVFYVYLLPGVSAQTSVRPGKFITEPPTLTNLGFEWYISGDDNRNATVSVAYRQTGAREWKTGMPLLRIGGERPTKRDFVDYVTPSMFAGSILDVNPGTEYECRFTMRDPDKVVGDDVQTVKVRTRTEPRAATGGRVLHVYHPKWAGPKTEPHFTTLKAAYYGSSSGDWSVLSERMVGPGDIIEVHAGLYQADRFAYTNPEGLPFDGAYVLTAKGTAERPIVIRAAGDGEVIFDGGDAYRLFDVMATAHHIFEGITIRNTGIAFYAGLKHVMGATDLTVRNCRMENVGMGVTTEYAGSKNFYIADNVLIGKDDRFRMIAWNSNRNPAKHYGETPIYSYTAIRVYGPGHVIAHNAIAFFHDAIVLSTYGAPEKEQDLKAVSVDIYNNDIHLMIDNFIEADGGVHNIRVMRNRGINVASCPLSAQPVYGGPAYFIRNIAYHSPGGCTLKFSENVPGLMVYHNTFISENIEKGIYTNSAVFNNLWLGTDWPQRPIAVFPRAPNTQSDYNGFRPNHGVADQYVWVNAAGRKGFAKLADYSSESGFEKHSRELDYDIFEHLQAPSFENPYKVYHAIDLDFRLKAGGKAIDAGIPINNVNDGFSGKAPDLGALESGEPDPVYGPRGPISNKPFYR